LADYEYKKEQHDKVMTNIKGKCNQVPKTGKLLKIKGIGLATVTGFLVNVRNFDSPKQIQNIKDRQQ